MSWNNGGPWGTGPSNQNQGGRRPSGSRPAGSGPSEVDVDEWIRKSQERIRQVFPGGGKGGAGGSPRLWGLLGIALAAMWLVSGFYQVSTNQVGVVLRFGKVVRTEQPGLRYHLPQPVETVLLTDFTNEKKIEIGFRSYTGSGQNQDVEDESRMLTGDENIVDIDFIVNWRISSAEEFLFNVRNPELTIKMAAESGIREVIGRMDIQPILTEKRLEIETQTRDLVQAMLDEYKAGITISRVQLLNVSPPPDVKDAFDDVTRARADGDRARNEAESYRNDVLPRARGEAEKLLQEAEGYKDMVVNIAKGDAARFESVLKAYSTANDAISTRLYFDTMEDVMRNATKLVIDPSASKGGVVPYLPLNDLTRKSATGAQ